VDGEKFDIVRTHRRTPHGEPLLVWGEYPDDALRVRSEPELLGALDALYAGAADKPRLLRVWTAADDQLVAVLRKDACALYVVESPEGYATSMGDHERTDSFQLADHEGHQLTVPWADCVSWDYARRAIVRFIEHSDLGDVPVEGRIPSLLLMMGDIDRKAALAARPDTPAALSETSLVRGTVPSAVDPADEVTSPHEVDAPKGPVEHARWARRLLEVLQTRELVELERGPNLDEMSYQLGGLLQAHAIDAEHSIETADWLANELGRMKGIRKLFATGGDLQVAIRRSRDT
ncbi:MAG: hypothetical protein JNL83_09635, partial [Myxococcales bacterium]|nr:hypothetical protein [Myxococcales bacterium]